MRKLWVLFFVLHGLLLCGCSSTNTIKVKSDEVIEVEQEQLQESSLLDVGIIVFEGGEISEEQ